MSERVLVWPDADEWQALWSAIEPVVTPALAALPALPDPLPRIEPGSASQPILVTPTALGLDPALLGPALHHPVDAAIADGPVAPLALDRWRRTAGLVLEGIAALALAEGGDAGAWWIVARAADQVHTVAPSLGWLWPEAADLLANPGVSLEQRPRAGAWVVRWLRDTGQEVPRAMPSLDDEAWTQFGAWCRDHSRGPAADAPMPLPLAPPVDPRNVVDLDPLSHAVVLRAGTPLAVEGPAAMVPELHTDGTESDRAVVGSVEGGVVFLRRPADPPAGNWVLRSGTMAGQVGSARGVELALKPDGTAELLAADGFVGPPKGPILEMAKRFGVSGISTGNWRVRSYDEGPPARGELELHGLDAEGVTVHARGNRRFALPAAAWMAPVRRFLAELDGTPVAWQLLDDGDLELRMKVYGVDVLLLLGPSTGDERPDPTAGDGEE